MADPTNGTADYDQLVTTIIGIARRIIPEDASVAVVSRGDDDLLRLDHRNALHFPQAEDGKWAGYHPSDGEAAIAMLDEMRDRGIEYFLLPNTAYWWLEYYEGLKHHLEDHYRIVERGEHCWIVQLAEPSASQLPLFELVTTLLPDDTQFALLANGAEAPSGVARRRISFLPIGTSSEGHEAVERLEALRARGIQFVVVSHELFDWLEDNPEVVDHLRSEYRFVTRQNYLCEIYQARSHREPCSSSDSKKPATETKSVGGVLRHLLPSLRRNGTHS